MKKKIVIILWSTLGSVILLAVLAFTAIAQGWIGYMPPVEELENPVSKYASQVISSDGQLLGTYSYKDNRIFTDFNSLSPYLWKALVATEDVRFFNHSGIDIRSLGRAIVKRGILGEANAGGGSTITQQLAKQLYSEQADNSTQRLFQKPIEWVIAVKLERNYTKEEILTMYLNYFDFLNGAVGIKTAARTYFGKEPKDLTAPEAATLIGMCKNPSYFNPIRHEDRCKGRRDVVIDQMLKAGYITESEAAGFKAEPLNMKKFHRTDHKDGIATYFREYLRKIMMAKKPNKEDYQAWQMQQYYADSLAWAQDPIYGWCNKNYKKNGASYNIYNDGLKIYTTIDSRMQKYAEQAVYSHVANFLQPKFYAEKKGKATAPFTSQLSRTQVQAILDKAMRLSDRYRNMKAEGYSDSEIRAAFNKKEPMTVFTYHGEVDTEMTPMDSIKYYKFFLRSGFMSMDPMTGYVKAYVGGLNYRYFQYDMVSLGRRQVGSTIKPFLYALAMENGFTPCDMALNAQRTYMVAGRPWTPRNASHARAGQMVTLKWGLANSSNWVSAYLMSRLNPVALKKLILEFGIRNNAIVPSMALCLGPCDLTVSELVSAYTAFANHGIRMAPVFVTKIVDNEGNVVANFQPQMNEVISEESAYRMLDMLRAVVDGGTAARLRYMYKFTGEMGAKTGTTNNNSDGWFIGITPSLISGCWVGGEDRDIHFDSMTYGQGAAMALPIWAYYMKKVYADKRLGYSQNEKFDVPADFQPCNTGGGSASSSEPIVEPAGGDKSADHGGVDPLLNN